MGINVDFADIWEKHGLKGIIFIMVVFILIGALKSKWFAKVLSKISDKFIELFIKSRAKKNNTSIKHITESDIINHDIFNYIDFWMYSKIPTFQFSTEYRTIAFRKYLIIFLKKYKSNLNDFVTDKSYEDMDESKLWKTLLNLLNKIVYDYEREMGEVGISKIIIDKMKIKNNDTISLTIDLIEGICNSQFYTSDKNLLKIYSILNIILSVLENTISNSENICNSINGQLKGMKIDGPDGSVQEP